MAYGATWRFREQIERDEDEGVSYPDSLDNIPLSTTGKIATIAIAIPIYAGFFYAHYLFAKLYISHM